MRLVHVTGNLTLLGITKPIELDVEVDGKLAGAGQKVGFKATGTIDRYLTSAWTCPVTILLVSGIARRAVTHELGQGL